MEIGQNQEEVLRGVRSKKQLRSSHAGELVFHHTPAIASSGNYKQENKKQKQSQKNKEKQKK